MDRTTKPWLAAIASVLALSAADAGAQSGSRAGQYSRRHLTLRERTLRFDIGPAERGINDSGILLGPYDESAYGLRFQEYDAGANDEVHVLLGFGLAYGIVDTLEIGVLAVPLNFEHGQKYGDLTAYVRWAFVDEEHFQIGLQGTVQTPTWSHLGFNVGLPMNFNLGRIARLETGAKVEVVFDDTDRDAPPDGDEDPRLAIDVPIALAFNVRPRGFLGARSDLLWDDRIGDVQSFRAGVGAFGGFTLLGDRTQYADFTGSFMGYFEDDTIDWEIVLGATVALGL